jgi:16S rRNA C1402 (ribose-2'-O) methylase RsmI
MAIYVSTCQPRKLLEDIKQAINDKKIVTTEELNKLIYKAICDSPVFGSWIKGKC